MGSAAILIPSFVAGWVFWEKYKSKRDESSVSSDIKQYKLSSDVRRAIEEQINDDLNVMMGAVAKELKKVQTNANSIAGELEALRVAIRNMKKAVEERNDEEVHTKECKEIFNRVDKAIQNKEGAIWSLKKETTDGVNKLIENLGNMEKEITIEIRK